MDNSNKPIPCQPPPQPYVQAQVYGMTASSTATHSAVPTVEGNEGFWTRCQKNKPQSNSITAASLLFISGGMNMAWNGFVIGYFGLQKHLILSWFIGGIIGVILGAVVCNHTAKKYLMAFASLLVVLGGILQVSDPNSYDTIVASRYLNGVAVGFIYPMTFVLIGEEVIKSMRGMNAAAVDIVSFSSGILIHMIYSASWSSNVEEKFQIVQMSGVLNILLGVAAVLVGYFYIIESPVFYLTRGDERNAIDSLRRLQKPLSVTHETYEQLEELKRYLHENEQRTIQENVAYGIPALLKLCFYRSFMALFFSLAVNFTFLLSWFQSDVFQKYPLILYALARLVGSLITSFTLDFKGRKVSLVTGFLVCTILSFAVGGIFNNKSNIIDTSYMSTIKYVLIIFQLFTGMAMTSSSAYLSEAFPLSVKPYYVAVVFTVEMLIHIIIIATVFNTSINFHIPAYFFTCGCLSLVFLIGAIFVMPETKSLTLRECLPRFRALKNFRN